ncbi:MAG: hypothetical protein ACP5MD_15515 [Verrucomicrobiia bacterium]
MKMVRGHHLWRVLGLISSFGAAQSIVLAADIVTWQIDSSASYVRLTIPDQALTVPDIGEVTLKLRNADSTSQWTDSGGRRAALTGELVTEYMDGVAIRFMNGSHNIRAVEQTSIRPNPSAWDANTESYTNTTSAPAALGARVRATLLFLTFDVAFVAFRNVEIDIGNLTGAPVLIANGAFDASVTLCGISKATVDVDGLALPLELGHPIPDVRGTDLPTIAATNSAGGTIVDMGGRSRRLTYQISISNLAIDLEGMSVVGSVEGLIVANATIPAPTPVPALAIEKRNDIVLVTWPTNSGSFRLEFATVLPTTNWFPVLIPPTVGNGLYTITNPSVGKALFYRLAYP